MNQSTNTTNPYNPSTANPYKKSDDRSDVVDQSQAEKITAGAQSLRDSAMKAASSSADTVQNQATQAMDVARNVAAQAGQSLQDKVSVQKSAGADFVHGFANSMRRAATEFDQGSPMAGNYLRKAADQVSVAADSIRAGNFNDLVQSATSFAKNQPTAFLGLAVLAGFGAVRFLKSSPAPSSANEI